MSDRELLELAAKAAGMEVDGLACKAIVQIDDELALLVRNSLGGNSIWNPLRNDGDALRLAVKTGIKIEMHTSWVYARAVIPKDPHPWREITEGWAITKEPYAATRRAIVRAAAEIGKAMP